MKTAQRKGVIVDALTEQEKQIVVNHVWMIHAYLRYHFVQYHDRQYEQVLEDLFQDGCMGLIDAVRNYDPACGFPFVSWAYPRISDAMLRGLWKQMAHMGTPRRAFRDDMKSGSVMSLERNVRNPVAHRKPPCREDEVTYRHKIFELLCESVDQGIQQVGDAKRSRRDRKTLARYIANERTLSRPSYQSSIREICEEKKTSRGRVTRIEKTIWEHTTETMKRSDELRRLSQEARRHPDGLDGVMGEEELGARSQELEGSRN